MIYFLGDVHGCFEHILPVLNADAPDDDQPKTVIFLGDLEAQRPFEDEILPLIDAGIEVWFIHGNHDTDSKANWCNLQASQHRNLDGRVVEIEGQRIAGLGGVFRGAIWMPGEAPLFKNLKEYERAERSRPGQKRRLTKMDIVMGQSVPAPLDDALREASTHGRMLKHASTIFPETVERLARLRADILVTHEAPSCHPHGFQEIDALAVAMHAKTVFHGHHHDSLDYRQWDTRLGFRAYGVGFCGILDMHGRTVLPGDFDEARRYRQQHPVPL